MSGHLSVIDAAETPRGGVVLLHEAFGVTPHIVSVGERFAAAGWTTVIPHLYHRSGSPTFSYDVAQGEGVDDRRPAAEEAAGRAIGPHALQLTEAGVMADVDDAVDTLAARGITTERIGLVGFCFGGSVALYASCVRAVGAAVAFYGAGIDEPHFAVPSFTSVAARRRTPLLGMYGALDRWIPEADVDVLEAALSLSDSPGGVVRFPAAGHGFHCDVRTTYEPGSAAQAWSTTLAWFERHAGTEQPR
ncbi:carboxymethylenebutenolidase [Rhodococcus sp. 27YEA15]